jgi:hypothetical protein
VFTARRVEKSLWPCSRAFSLNQKVSGLRKFKDFANGFFIESPTYTITQSKSVKSDHGEKAAFHEWNTS